MTRKFVMEFERPLVELEEKLAELNRLDLTDKPDLLGEVSALAEEIERLRHDTYEHLTPWARVQISRHPNRPKTQDYLSALFTDVVELHGDRLYGDDEAMFAGLGTLQGRRVALLGHRKGKTTKENIRRNFGSPHPEGFRKAMRIMRLAERFGLPLVTFLDTAGAFPGIEAEERGQALAIAESLELLSGLRVPIVVVGIGEGGSGGALAIGFGDRIIMLENAYYSVITPEACASILYKDSAHAEDAAGCLKMTADELVGLGIADEIVPEPPGGVQNDPAPVMTEVGARIGEALDAFSGIDPGELTQRRYERLRAVGVYGEASA